MCTQGVTGGDLSDVLEPKWLIRWKITHIIIIILAKYLTPRTRKAWVIGNTTMVFLTFQSQETASSSVPVVSPAIQQSCQEISSGIIYIYNSDYRDQDNTKNHMGTLELIQTSS